MEPMFARSSLDMANIDGDTLAGTREGQHLWQSALLRWG
jgi:hypothetical protein